MRNIDMSVVRDDNGDNRLVLVVNIGRAAQEGAEVGTIIAETLQAERVPGTNVAFALKVVALRP